VCGDEVLGYSYASAYRPRPGYRYTVENSIYVADAVQRMGLGKRLLEDLIVTCTEMNFRQMIAVVGDSENIMSIDFHKKMGFQQVGIIKSIGYKFDRWMDSVLLQLQLGDGDKTLPDD
jgi:phosphinothricin acetyltransferase